jgi:hypothetical protein
MGEWSPFCKNITFILYVIYNVRYNKDECSTSRKDWGVFGKENYLALDWWKHFM